MKKTSLPARSPPPRPFSTVGVPGSLGLPPSVPHPLPLLQQRHRIRSGGGSQDSVNRSPSGSGSGAASGSSPKNRAATKRSRTAPLQVGKNKDKNRICLDDLRRNCTTYCRLERLYWAKYERNVLGRCRVKLRNVQHEE